MPQGDKSKYTSKQKRKAEHIAEGYEDSGVSTKEAKSRAWATVNKESGGGKKSGSGRGKQKGTAPLERAARRAAADRISSMPNKNQQLSTRTTRGAKVKPAAKRGGKYAGNGGNGRSQASKQVKKLDEPKSPLPPQHQAKPGKESELTPRPNYQAPLYKGAEN